MRWRYSMPANWRCGASKPRSSFPAHSPAAPITSRIPPRPPTRSAQPSMKQVHTRSEEHTSELQSHSDLVCRLLLEKKKENKTTYASDARANKVQASFAGK